MKWIYTLMLLIALHNPVNAQVLQHKLVIKNVEKAFLLSEVFDKPLLLCFTGADWDLSSQLFTKKLKESSERELHRDVIVAILDFPLSHQQAIPVALKHQRLKERYSIQEVPSCVLIDQSHREIGRFLLPRTISELKKHCHRALASKRAHQPLHSALRAYSF